VHKLRRRGITWIVSQAVVYERAALVA
jgi:hypothetical protein